VRADAAAPRRNVAGNPQPITNGEGRIDAAERGGDLAIAHGERPFELIPRLRVLAGEPACEPGGPMCDPRLGRIGSCLDIAEEGRCVRPHRWQLASHVAAGP